MEESHTPQQKENSQSQENQNEEVSKIKSNLYINPQIYIEQKNIINIRHKFRKHKTKRNNEQSPFTRSM